MTYTIFKNWHYSLPPKMGFSFSNKFKWEIEWNDSCRYGLQSVDQKDINKLCGVRMNMFSNHTNSFRFGWLYNLETSLIDIYAYYYIDKVRKWQKLTSLSPLSITTLEIIFLSHSVEFIANGRSYFVSYSGRDKMKYQSGLFFGGNRSAPHTIKVKIKKFLKC